MDRNAQIWDEFLAILDDCARGHRTMQQYMEWEVHQATEDDYSEIDDELAGRMSALAGAADEFSYLFADEREFRELAREELEKLRGERAAAGGLLAAD